LQQFFLFFLKYFPCAGSGKVLYNGKMNPAEEVCELAALAEGKPLAVFPRGLPVLLVRRGNEIFALENRCPHMGCPLAAGALEGYILQCPCHDWRPREDLI